MKKKNSPLTRRGKISRGMLALATTGSELRVPVINERGGLAVHANVNDDAAVRMYVITHVASGLGLASFSSMNDAIMAMKELAGVLPWKMTAERIVHIATPSQVVAARTIVEDYGGRASFVKQARREVGQ